jgi:hypothetical protein
MSFGMLRRVALVITDVSEEHFAYIIASSCQFDDGGDTILRNANS